MNPVNIEKQPILTQCQRLLKPIKPTQTKINEIARDFKDNNTPIIYQGLFVLLVASFELMLIDILRYYLRTLPGNLANSKFEVNKKDLLYQPHLVVENEIEKELINISYKSIDEMLNKFCNILSIKYSRFPKDIIEQLVEIKACRNLLLHNNLIVNKTYIEKAGNMMRSRNLGDTLKIDSTYLKSTMKSFDILCGVINHEISTKYCKYTRIASIKNLWQYLFKSPVMKFDDYWEVDLDKDKVRAYKGSSYEDKLSNSERMFLDVWRSHFHGNSYHINNFSMYSLDTDNKGKMLFFLAILDDFRLY